MSESKNLPLVSVVVPCYNRARYVREAIDSALAQTYPSLEIIAVDDGSTDDTPAILASYSPRIKVITQKNGGSSVARNAAFEASHGEFLAWLDSDDAWLPEKIQCQIDAAHRWPEANLIHTRCVGVDENSQPPPSKMLLCPEPVLEEHILEQLLDECQVMTSSCMLRREALESVGGFDPQWLFAEDWELYLRLALHAPFVFVPAPLTRYRVHAESKSKDSWPHALGQMKLRAAIEARIPALLATQDTPAIRRAIGRHTLQYARAYYRLGRLYQIAGEPLQARDAYHEAMRLEPRVFKYRTHYWRMALTASLRKALAS